MYGQLRNPYGYRFLLAILLLLASLLGSIALSAAPVHAGDYVPLKGRFVGVGAVFSGNFTHIGKFQGVLDQGNGTAVWTAANGDTITNQTTAFDYVEEIIPDVLYRYEQTLEITGGTGRFANTTGNATAMGLINVETGAYVGMLTGTIARPK